jgi:hypothetical protein
LIRLAMIEQLAEMIGCILFLSERPDKVILCLDNDGRDVFCDLEEFHAAIGRYMNETA